MDYWARKFITNLDRNDVRVFLFKKYVDDMNLALSLTRPGVAWERNMDGSMHLVWTQEREERASVTNRRNQTAGYATMAIHLHL